MVERRIYHVLQREDASWQVLREGFRRPHIVRQSKAEAVLLAKRLAKTGSSARVVVHQDDHVEREFHFMGQRHGSESFDSNPRWNVGIKPGGQRD